MEKKHTSLKFKAKVKPIEKINSEFTLCKCYVQGIGKNRNFSYMSKENVERCLPTLSYAPVVGHLIDKLDDDGNPTGEKYMGGHDYYINDNWELKSACVPYGVVKADSFGFETVKEYEDEVETEYVTADVILWTGRYPELMEAIYAEDFYFNQSMEVSVEDWRPYDGDSNYTELVDFTYSALCLLGKADDKNSVEHTEPCFIESKVIPIQYSIEKNEFSKVMGELKEELAFYFKDNVRKEETSMEDFKNEVTETVEEVVEESTETVVECATEETPETEITDVVEEAEINEVEEATDEVADEVVEEETSEESTEANEYELLKAEYEEYKNAHSHSNEEFDSINAQLKDYQAKEETAQKDALFTSEDYSSISDKEEFKALAENHTEFSVDELKSKLDTIILDYAKKGSLNFSAEPEKKTVGMTRLPIQTNANKKSRYGSLFSK